MGGGKSSGNSTTTVQESPEQKAALAAQTQFLTNTAFPAYTNTINGAGNVYNSASKNTTNAANNASNVASQTGALQQGVGSNSLAAGTSGTGSMANYQAALGSQLASTGASGLSSLFTPQYEQQQVDAALQAGRESARESQAGQNAMYGGAGGLGSSRQALADSNMASLNAQRQATAAAGARAGVQANKAAAANSLLTSGTSANNSAQAGYGALAGQGANALSAANTAAGSQINYAQSPQDLYSKYASVVFGTPQGNTTPNFAGTQGSTQTGNSKGFGGSLK